MSRVPLCLFYVIALLTSCTRTVPPTTVTVDGGEVEGFTQDGPTVFKGIPFAAPPVGRLRWREPQPVIPWEGVLAAHDYAPACMQVGVSMPGEPSPSISEDCLYLNIWSPANDSDEALPVMVWIHGGGFSNGATSLPLYAGDELARRGVIVVSIAYRLGPLGFLAHPELTAESPRATSGNFGLMDQVAALHWVQNNIESFGGDRENVTVFGQSAGATSISILMASPTAQGLFHRAIGQSGGVFEPLALAPNWLLANAEQEGLAYASSLAANSLQELRQLPAERLLEGMAHNIAHPVLDSYFLPEPPFEVFSKGEQQAIPLLVGSNADEARSLTDVSDITVENYAAAVTDRWGSLPQALIDAYSYETDKEAKQARLNFERDLRFGWDIWAWARLHSRTGSPDVYYYYFAHEPPFLPGSPYEGWGASHFAELWYVLGRVEEEPWGERAADTELSNDVMTYWTNFARTGNPNGSGLPNWPRYGEAQSVMYLKVPLHTGATPNTDKLRIFESVYSGFRGER